MSSRCPVSRVASSGPSTARERGRLAVSTRLARHGHRLILDVDAVIDAAVLGLRLCLDPLAVLRDLLVKDDTNAGRGVALLPADRLAHVRHHAARNATRDDPRLERARCEPLQAVTERMVEPWLKAQIAVGLASYPQDDLRRLQPPAARALRRRWRRGVSMPGATRSWHAHLVRDVLKLGERPHAQVLGVSALLRACPRQPTDLDATSAL